MVDRYTKAMLTIIAACLLYLCVRTTFSVSDVHAAVQANKGMVDVNIVRVGGFDFTNSTFGRPSVPVRVTNK